MIPRHCIRLCLFLLILGCLCDLGPRRIREGCLWESGWNRSWNELILLLLWICLIVRFLIGRIWWYLCGLNLIYGDRLLCRGGLVAFGLVFWMWNCQVVGGNWLNLWMMLLDFDNLKFLQCWLRFGFLKWRFLIFLAFLAIFKFLLWWRALVGCSFLNLG